MGKKKSSSVSAHRKEVIVVGGFLTLNSMVSTGLSGKKKKKTFEQNPKRDEMVNYISAFSDYVHMFIYFV